MDAQTKILRCTPGAEVCNICFVHRETGDTECRNRHRVGLFYHLHGDQPLPIKICESVKDEEGEGLCCNICGELWMGQGCKAGHTEGLAYDEEGHEVAFHTQ